MSKKRIAVFVDGFNLYHGLLSLNKNHLKWFSIKALLKDFIDNSQEEISSCFYFTATATWDLNKIRRQTQLLIAFRMEGVISVKGRFQRVPVRASRCLHQCLTTEEKETDVNIALTMFGEAVKGNYEIGILLSNDSDQAPTLNAIKKQFPNIELRVIVPPTDTPSNELRRISNRFSILSEEHFTRAQMPREIRNEKGSIVATRPPEYDPPET